MHEEEDLGSSERDHYIKARKLFPNNFGNLAFKVGKNNFKRYKTHFSCSASFSTQQVFIGSSQTILQSIRNIHSKWRRVMVNWVSYLHEEEKQDDDEDTDFGMDPGSRFP